jgi:hypothetical protein
MNRNETINFWCDWIEEYNALLSLWHCYINDAFDLDMNGSFVWTT